jgi:hypothetical protein
VIFVGEVERCGLQDCGGQPLVFQGGQFSTVSPLDR